jgi:serine/threonine protein kinase
LKSVHEMNCLHRDIRPANILTSGVGAFTLIDFGLSVEGEEIESSQFLGTPLYAPQAHLQGLGGDKFIYNVATDLESLVKTWCSLVFSRRALASLIRTQFDMHKEFFQNGNGKDSLGKKLAADWDRLFDDCNHAKSALEAARASNYEKLKEIFGSSYFFLDD